MGEKFLERERERRESREREREISLLFGAGGPFLHFLRCLNALQHRLPCSSVAIHARAQTYALAHGPVLERGCYSDVPLHSGSQHA